MNFAFLREFSFAQPWWLILLVILPAVGWLLGGSGRPSALRYSSAALLRVSGRPALLGPKKILWLLRLLILALLIVAIAQPRKERGSDEQRKYGIDVVLCCDTSVSMGYKDFYLNGKKVRRMDALLDAIGKFVKARPNDRTGAVTFGSFATIISPLTLDASWLKEVMAQVVPWGTTAIGEGLFASVDVLKSSKEKSRVILLVTDGQNNTGRPPEKAAEYAKKNGIRIYTLQILDFQSFAKAGPGGPLAKIARDTGGQHFIASDTDALIDIYRHIDQLEKHRIEQKQFRLYTPLFAWVVLAALLLILAELSLGNSLLLHVP